MTLPTTPRKISLLSKLRINEISLCAAPASPGADVMLFKSEDQQRPALPDPNTYMPAGPGQDHDIKTRDDADAALHRLGVRHARPGETVAQALGRLGTEGNETVNRLYNKRRQLPSARKSTPGDGVQKAHSTLLDAAHTIILKNMEQGHRISEADALAQAVTANPELYDAWREWQAMRQQREHE